MDLLPVFRLYNLKACSKGLSGSGLLGMKPAPILTIDSNLTKRTSFVYILVLGAWRLSTYYMLMWWMWALCSARKFSVDRNVETDQSLVEGSKEPLRMNLYSFPRTAQLKVEIQTTQISSSPSDRRWLHWIDVLIQPGQRDLNNVHVGECPRLLVFEYELGLANGNLEAVRTRSSDSFGISFSEIMPASLIACHIQGKIVTLRPGLGKIDVVIPA